MINQVEHGVVFTKKSVVSFMLNEVGYMADKDLSAISILEPSSGQGAFILEIITRLYKSSITFGFDFELALKNITAVEIDSKNMAILRSIVNNLEYSKKKISSCLNLVEDDFLLWENKHKFDIIISNPPYIRWDNINSKKKKHYRSLFSTFRGRADIYIPFYEKGLSLLKQDGVLNYICSNRWFKSSYGRKLRQLISQKYNLVKVFDLEEANPFQDDVNAYPAITILKNRTEFSQKSVSYTKVDHINLLNSDLKFNFIKQKTNSNEAWFLDNSINESNRKYYSLIADQGFQISIGIATGKDSVYISDDFEGKIESELLVPLITSKHLKGNKLSPSTLQVINCHDNKGNIIDLTQYPKAHKYFLENESLIRSRHISKKNPSQWFRTIDKIKLDLIKAPKILLPDISGNTKIIIDEGHYYPHHNIYYISGKDINKLKVLAGCLMSGFVRTQLLSLSSKMNGGYPRWQSQNLKRLFIPNINKMNDKWCREMEFAYSKSDIDQIDKLVQLDLVKTYYTEIGQMTLFEPIVKYNK